MTSVVAVLQARAGSRRLPNKVLLDLLGQPMLARQIERIRRAERIDELVVATTTERSDDAVVDLCERIGVRCFRGSTDDVLARFVGALDGSTATWVVRLTGDCPLTDPAVLDRAIKLALTNQYDYVSNTLSPSYPDGLDVEVMRLTALRQANAESTLASEREHVTPYIHKNPARFSLGELNAAVDHSALRWTVDEPQDFELITAVYASLYPHKPDFDTGDILTLLAEHPELSAMNGSFARNEGYELSLQKDLT